MIARLLRRLGVEVLSGADRTTDGSASYRGVRVGPLRFEFSPIGDYMRRYLVESPWGTLRAHNILRSDEDRHYHDHPWDFRSLVLGPLDPRPVLRGEVGLVEWLRLGYVEHVPAETLPLYGAGACDRDGRPVGLPQGRKTRHVPRLSLVRRAATDLHMLELARPVWTIVVTGPRRRSWGFATERGWIHWRDYAREYPREAAATR